MSGNATKFFLAALLCSAGQAVLACDYCERKVTLTPPLAECYLATVDKELLLMEETGLPAQLINLASCDEADSATRGGITLPVMSGTEEITPSLSFVLDAPALRCLASSLKEESWSPDLIKTFEVRRDCETQ